MKKLTIGKLAEQCHISADALRYYEKLKLIKPAGRTESGYRVYDANAARVLRFIRGAKDLGFTLEEICKLLELRASDKTTCAEILKLTSVKIREAQTKILELQEIKRVLTKLAKQCPADDSTLEHCPIIGHIKKAKILGVVLAASLFAFQPQTAQAKPLSYVGGTMVMQETDETGHTLSVDYTFDPKYAVALYAKKEDNQDKEFLTVGPQFNTLIKRWNLPDGQGNIFNMTGAGVSRWHGDEEFSAWTGILADYETRRIFTSYEVRLMYAGDIEKSAWQRARVGFAPYLANYDDLNTWFMLQVDHHPAKDDTVVVTPLVRFFYKTTLMEAGYSSNDHLMFNWILQF